VNLFLDLRNRLNAGKALIVISNIKALYKDI